MKRRSTNPDVFRQTDNDVVLTRTRITRQNAKAYLKRVFKRVKPFSDRIVYFEDPWENRLLVKKADWTGEDVMERVLQLAAGPRESDDEDLLQHILSSTSIASPHPAWHRMYGNNLGRFIDILRKREERASTSAQRQEEAE